MLAAPKRRKTTQEPVGEKATQRTPAVESSFTPTGPAPGSTPTLTPTPTPTPAPMSVPRPASKRSRLLVPHLRPLGGRKRGSARDSDVVIAPGEPYIVCENLVKIYQIADIEVFALQGLDMVIRRGELMAIIGASGSGKSTLLNILGGLDNPTGGKVRVGAWNLSKLSSSEAVTYKRQVVGFVWQNVSRNLVPYLTALENVELPMIINGTHDRAWAKELLTAVGLGDRVNHKPKQLSGGEQQRVGIAIGLANKPELLLADEPTGSLDRKSGRIVLDMFRRVRDIYGVTVVIVTHDLSMAGNVDRYVRIADGKISSESVRRIEPQMSEASEAGSAEASGATHDEYTVLDSAGRLQIPEEYRSALGIKNRVKLHMEDGRVVIMPPDDLE